MKKPSYKKTIESFQIHMKDGREKFLNEVAMWYERMYPRRAAYYKRALRQLREVQTNSDASWTDAKGRHAYVSMRVPQELYLFIKSWVPDFGNDSADIDLLCRVWCDLVRTRKDNRRHTRLYVCKEFRRESEPDAPFEETKQATEERTGQDGGKEDPIPDGPRARREGAQCSCLGDHNCTGLCRKSGTNSVLPAPAIRSP